MVTRRGTSRLRLKPLSEMYTLLGVPDTASIVIVKRFDYRGADEEFSNRYHFEGTTPANRAAWKTLADAIITAERPTTISAVKFCKAYGYEPSNDNSVAQIDYRVPPDTPELAGTSPASGQQAPGDVAATIRWFTGAYNSRGKKIYCRKYMHGVIIDAGDEDKLNINQITTYGVFANKLIDGTLPGSFKYCGPQGADLSDPRVDPYLTTRTLKRRGRRPPTT